MRSMQSTIPGTRSCLGSSAVSNSRFSSCLPRCFVGFRKPNFREPNRLGNRCGDSVHGRHLLLERTHIVSKEELSWLLPSTMIAMFGVIAIGCSRNVTQSHPPAKPYTFLGIAENEESKEGPVGLLGGQSTQLSIVSKVLEVSYSEFKRAKEMSRVVAEEEHDGFVYWAVEETRDVPFDNATAWVFVLDRFKSPIE